MTTTTPQTGAAEEGLLKACPFCGSTDALVIVGGFVECEICETEGPFGQKGDRAAAIEAWNTRTPTNTPASQTDAIERLVMAAARVANKYGRDPVTDELLDWHEWTELRESITAIQGEVE